MTKVDVTPELHAEIWDQLAWFANGSLSDAERARVELHLEECPDCERELAFLNGLRSHVREREPLLLTPERSLEAVSARIEALEAAERGWLSWGDVLRIGRARLPKAAWPTLLRRPLVAAIWIAAIVAGLLLMYQPVAQFRTLTTVETPDAAPAPSLRVVFDGAATAEEIQTLLNGIDADIAAGPSRYGVYTLHLRPTPADGRAERALEELRRHPIVRFVEPIR